jgi:hypothetical protein
MSRAASAGAATVSRRRFREDGGAGAQAAVVHDDAESGDEADLRARHRARAEVAVVGEGRIASVMPGSRPRSPPARPRAGRRSCLNSKNDPYISKKRMLVLGPRLILDVPGFLNLSLLALYENNAPRNVDRYTYKTLAGGRALDSFEEAQARSGARAARGSGPRP